MANHTRFWIWGMALLMLVGCRRSPAVGERFTLRDSDTVRIRGTALGIAVLWIAALRVDASQASTPPHRSR